VYGGGAGFGGAFSAEAGVQLTVGGDVVATGGASYPDGEGGWIELGASGPVFVSSDLDASAANGGVVMVNNAGLASISGRLMSRGSRGAGGFVDVAACDVDVLGTLDAGASNGGSAGTIDVAGYGVSIESMAHVVALPCAESRLHILDDRSRLSDDPSPSGRCPGPDDRVRSSASALLNTRQLFPQRHLLGDRRCSKPRLVVQAEGNRPGASRAMAVPPSFTSDHPREDEIVGSCRRSAARLRDRIRA
jgi:hypothetical protein